MRNILFSALAALTFICSTIPGFAQEYKIGNLEIDHPKARATLPGSPVSGGYMTIRNSGKETDRLLAVEVDFAGKTEIHEMSVENDVMKMRQMPDGIEIPAGGEVSLEPGGYHVMFMSLNEQLKKGEKRKATLIFEKAGKLDVDFSVEVIKPKKAMDHSNHSTN